MCLSQAPEISPLLDTNTLSIVLVNDYFISPLSQTKYLDIIFPFLFSLTAIIETISKFRWLYL